MDGSWADYEPWYDLEDWWQFSDLVTSTAFWVWSNGLPLSLDGS